VTIISVSLLFILESSGGYSYTVEMLIVLPTTIALALLLLRKPPARTVWR